ncbi:PTS fructose transporter subunit IIA [Bacillus sp. V3-13]|uniref:BglG family transcription antiterminator n=1 Tax=Bacillus sp. V3-13 TaxID=2053728 RepID=UPI000C777CA9|nr:BglG family transcription antiterminator [Bacillus sp. V3-13]PLR76731.1 PTS fructose transporter subunit IIA [Bacillus sp. V3-13]
MILEERPSILLNHLVRFKKTTIPQLMDQTQLSKRQIKYDLDKINHWLKEKKLPFIIVQRNQYIDVPAKVLDHVSDLPASTKVDFILTEEERFLAIYLYIFARNEPISSAHLTDLLKVSKNTVISDVRKLNDMITPFLVKVSYSRKSGYHLKGTEWDKRVLLMNQLNILLQKPYGEKLLHYILRKGEHEIHLEEITHHLLSLEREFQLQFVEERLDQFAFFLQFYCIRQRADKIVQIYSDELDVLMQDPLKAVANKLVHLLNLEEAESEIGYLIIQLHGLSLGNASVVKDDHDLLLSICDRLVTEFESKACVTFQKKNNVIETLYQHIKPAYYRMKYRIPISNPLLNQIKREHKELYFIVKELLLPIESLLNITIPDEEIGFITIHFGALLENPKQLLPKKKSAVIVCPSGISSSLMVKHQLESLFSEISVDQTVSLKEFNNSSFSDFDIIFSTVPLQTRRHYYLVKPIMTPMEKSSLINEVYQNLFGIEHQGVSANEFIQMIEEFANIFDREGLKNALNHLSIHKNATSYRGNTPVLTDLITKDTIQFKDQLPDWEEAIKVAAQPLLMRGVIEPSYIDAIIDNVKTLGPYVIIGPEIAIPHARPEMGVNQIGMSFLKLSEPVYFCNDEKYPVSLLFCIAAIDNKSHLKALSQLTRLLSNKDEVQKLKRLDTAEEVLELLDQYSKVI